MRITGSKGMYTGMYDKVSDINEKKDAKNGAAGYSADAVNMNAGMDTTAKNLQSQIANTKKAIEKIDKDARMSAEEKVKKKQELDRKLSELTSRLKQHQIEQSQQKKEEMQKSESAFEPQKPVEKDAENNMPDAKNMEMLISAQSGINMSRVHARVADDLDGSVRVISSQISIDRQRGADVTLKEEEREKLIKRAEKAANSQMKELHGVFKDVKKASQPEDEKDKKNKDDDGRVILKVAGTSSDERNNIEGMYAGVGVSVQAGYGRGNS